MEPLSDYPRRLVAQDLLPRPTSLAKSVRPRSADPSMLERPASNLGAVSRVVPLDVDSARLVLANWLAARALEEARKILEKQDA